MPPERFGRSRERGRAMSFLDACIYSPGGFVDMRVLAARFRETGKASAVLDALRRQMHVPSPDVAIAPLAILGSRSRTDMGDAVTVLAGRFPDDAAPHVAELVRRGGGEIVADVDERWTRPRLVGGSGGAISSFPRGPVHA